MKIPERICSLAHRRRLATNDRTRHPFDSASHPFDSARLLDLGFADDPYRPTLAAGTPSAIDKTPCGRRITQFGRGLFAYGSNGLPVVRAGALGGGYAGAGTGAET